jgi:ATP-dependent DNA helicase RecG
MDIQYLKGVGPKMSKHLNALGIYTVNDLLYFFPRNYEDRGKTKAINNMIDGESVSVIGEVSIIYPTKRAHTGKYINRIVFKNETGFVVGTWFNQPYIKNNFTIGQRVMLYGKVSRKMGEIQIIDPQYERDVEVVPDNKIMPIYPASKYVTQSSVRKSMQQALTYMDELIFEVMPESIRKVFGLLDIKVALREIHFPTSFEILTLAEKRIKFEELLILQLGLFLAKSNFSQDKTALPIPVCQEMKNFKDDLPFTLTSAQTRTVREILKDMKDSKPMNRLVQGDVGSGKTIVAIIALFNCAMMGYQAAMMAPTEILAEQHFHSISKIMEKWNLKVALLKGSLTKKQKENLLKQIAAGEVDIVVGTHALIQNYVEFKKLALAITDEQHRFGVRQRAELIDKGYNPHVLVMTATPIPRTLALFMYGDMDISIINELPPGRQKIETKHVGVNMRDKVYDFVKQQVNIGHQAYVVCPLVEESEKLEAESAVEISEFLKENYFKDFHVGLLHGKMKPKEKDDIMLRFKNGEIKVLVSTTVIEVGVNVPNATIMIVENADRFGLAQLHQLRGRVGRGEHKSYCILITESKSHVTMERMKIMTQTSDGFIIAEKDMEIRGTGEFFGTRQHGLPELKLANLVRDIEILKETRDIIKELVECKRINDDDFKLLKKEVYNKFNEKFDDATFN